MGIQHTPNFGIAYMDDLTPLTELDDVTRQVAESLDAAMGRAGYTPPSSESFAALAADVAAINARATPSVFRSAETGTPPSLAANNWTTIPLVSRPLNGAGSTTVDRFTASSAGLYEVQGFVPFSPPAAALTRIGARITINALGATDRPGATAVYPAPGSALYPAPAVADYTAPTPLYLVSLVAGDVVRLDGYQQGSTASNVRSGVNVGAQLVVKQLTRTS